MDFALFILVTAILFIRPTDLIPGLEANLYVMAMVPCLIVSWHKILPQLTTVGLRERPVLVFGIGILALAITSTLAHGYFDTAWVVFSDFGKVLLFYLLISAQLDSTRRLKVFVGCLVGIILIPILVAMAHYHGYIAVPALDKMVVEGRFDPRTGEETALRRFGTTGNFADPNDVCEIVNCALIFSLYGLLDREGGCTRVFWLAPLGVFGHALYLTHSRGGFLGLVVGLSVLLRGRFGAKKALLAAGLALPLMFVLFAGRQTSIELSGGTGQGRIQLWDDGFRMLRESPLIGAGWTGFARRANHVAHNAFVQMYAELGFAGGTLFVGQYLYCLTNLAKLGSKRVTLPDEEMRRLQPFVMASMASFATTEMSVSNSTNLVTYVMLGVATVFIRLTHPRPPLPDLLLSGRLVRRVILFSGLFLAALFVFIRLMVRY